MRPVPAPARSGVGTLPTGVASPDGREWRLVGPVPAGRDADEYDRERRRILWSMPSGLYVLGSASAGRRNLMTLNWATQVATDPKLVAVSVEAAAVTHDLVAQDGGAFTLNLIARVDRAIVRKFAKPLDDEGDPAMLAGFACPDRGHRGAHPRHGPAAWLDCRLTSGPWRSGATPSSLGRWSTVANRTRRKGKVSSVWRTPG